DAEAGPEALLRVSTALEDPRDQRAGGRAGLVRPSDQTPRRPLRVLAMGSRHMRGDGSVTVLVGAAVTGDTLAAMEVLHGMRGEPRLDLRFDELIGDGVVVAVELDVIVDMHARLLPNAEHVRLCRERRERRAIELLEERAS